MWHVFWGYTCWTCDRVDVKVSKDSGLRVITVYPEGNTWPKLRGQQMGGELEVAAMYSVENR